MASEKLSKEKAEFENNISAHINIYLNTYETGVIPADQNSKIIDQINKEKSRLFLEADRLYKDDKEKKSAIQEKIQSLVQNSLVKLEELKDLKMAESSNNLVLLAFGYAKTEAVKEGVINGEIELIEKSIKNMQQEISAQKHNFDKVNKLKELTNYVSGQSRELVNKTRAAQNKNMVMKWNELHGQYAAEEKKLQQIIQNLEIFTEKLPLSEDAKKKTSALCVSIKERLSELSKDLALPTFINNPDDFKNKLEVLPGLVIELNGYVLNATTEINNLTPLALKEITDLEAKNNQYIKDKAEIDSDSKKISNDITQIRAANITSLKAGLLPKLKQDIQDLEKDLQNNIAPERESYKGVFGWFKKSLNKEAFQQTEEAYLKYFRSYSAVSEAIELLKNLDENSVAKEAIEKIDEFTVDHGNNLSFDVSAKLTTFRTSFQVISNYEGFEAKNLAKDLNLNDGGVPAKISALKKAAGVEEKKADQNQPKQAQAQDQDIQNKNHLGPR